MRIESNNLIDYFVVCGLNIKSGLESNESYLGWLSVSFYVLFCKNN